MSASAAGTVLQSGAKRWRYALASLAAFAVGWSTHAKRKQRRLPRVSESGAQGRDAGLGPRDLSVSGRVTQADPSEDHSTTSPVLATAGDFAGDHPREPSGAPAHALAARAVIASESATWLKLPDAESLGFRGPGAFALPGVGSLAMPHPLPGVVRPRGPEAYGRAKVRARAHATDRPWILTIVTISALALTLRLIGHSTNYAVFIDEITYSNIVQSVALGHGVLLYGAPFFLHPPLVFYFDATLLKLFGDPHASLISLVFQLRLINCAIGAVDCALVMLLVSRAAGRVAAISAGVFIAIDPFLLLWDGRVLLETLAMTTAIGGWLCLDWVVRREHLAGRAAGVSSRGEEAMIALGGLLFGASLLSKETYAFAGVVPLAALVILGSPVRRRVTGLMLTVAMGCYALFVAKVIADGRFSEYFNQQFVGVLRAVGTKQETGFHAAGHHASFASSLSADLSQYLISYLVIGLVGLAAPIGAVRWVRAARAGDTLAPERRLAIALGCGSVSYVGYAVLFGAFETQIFYMCILGVLPVLATEVRASVPGLSLRVGRRRLLVAGVVIASLAVVFELAVDVRQRTETDTALPQMVAYVQHHVDYPALVDSTDGVSAFVLTGVRVDGPTTVGGLERDRPGYVIVEPKLVSKGFSTLGPGFQAWLRSHARVVYRSNGPSTGPLVLWRTTYASQDAGS